MKVSFGQVYVKGVANRYQRQVNDMLLDAFQINNPWSDDVRDRKTVERHLEDEKQADVFIKNTINGNVDVEVKAKSFFDVSDMESAKGYVPFDAKGVRKLMLSIKPDKIKSMYTLQHKIENFAEHCRDYALNPNCKKNEDKEHALLMMLDKELSEREHD